MAPYQKLDHQRSEEMRPLRGRGWPAKAIELRAVGPPWGSKAPAPEVSTSGTTDLPNQLSWVGPADQLQLKLGGYLSVSA